MNNLLLSTENHIATITINRPKKLNALNFETLMELKQAFEQMSADDEVRGVIITGAGDKSFVAGADISELAGLSVEQSRAKSQEIHELFFTIENFHKPVIAAVNGFALGGGCELAMACHMRVASENAKFGQPEVNLGIIPGYGGTQRLPKLVGKGKAIELMITGDMVDAEEALDLGLVNHVVARVDLMEKCKEILAKAAQKGPIAVANTIKATNACHDHTKKGYELEAQLFSACTHTEDFKEGTQAFLEKRPAKFKGR